jgi:hypothetical protein
VIPIANIFPPAQNTISGDNITASRFLNSTPLIARALQDLASKRYIGNLLLPNRVQTSSGSINYEVVGEGITAADAPVEVTPGAEYQLTQTSNGTVSTVATAKYGEDTIVTDEAVSRYNFSAVNKSLMKMSNSAKILIDAAVLSAISSAATYTAAAGAVWNTGTPKILLDILKAKAAMSALNLGYSADTLLVGEDIWPFLAADTTIATAMGREDKSNPIYTGRFNVLAGLEIIPVPTANMPGGVNTSAFLLDRAQAGFILTENLGGGYTSAGDLTEVKSYREEGSDGVRVRVRTVFKAVVTDPGAIYKITTVA